MLLALAAFMLSLATCFCSVAHAHTVAYGYVAGTQPGQYTFWFGTYHSIATANYTEGSLRLTCGGGFAATVPFTTLVTTKPTGLVTGTNYYYDAGYGGEAGSPLAPYAMLYRMGGAPALVARSTSNRTRAELGAAW